MPRTALTGTNWAYAMACSPAASGTHARTGLVRTGRSGARVIFRSAGVETILPGRVPEAILSRCACDKTPQWLRCLNVSEPYEAGPAWPAQVVEC